eukprot:CAMPEP_0194246188 /NCGR_PEP_ID=MMETSP0158-20130606/14621_1 /TAXON_ID=33649 /ORGANISM="Thalassionema nitzschioides, Strain L26-B" /LENGTH=316 /DNA_ID=CAMNT_0038982035 /DNA_START=69 /DNA_END=1016 /DNA_ORIENTATION=-
MMSRILSFFVIISSAWSFQPALQTRPVSQKLTRLQNQASAIEKIKLIIQAEDYPDDDPRFDAVVKRSFPEALTNKDLGFAVVDILAEKGFTKEKTLLATSLCCDELARRLEDDFVKIYGNNFNLGGLAGFPFAGNTGFGAMSAHIPDDGFCLIIYGPHVGIAKDGAIGKVEREGVALVETCCGSAVAANNYLKQITDGGMPITTHIQNFSDFQQGAVQELILPFGKRLADASDRMLELPYALYESQDLLLGEIIKEGAKGLKRGTAVLGGIQINTSPDTMDYFHPLRFDYIDGMENTIEDLLPLISVGGDVQVDAS